MAFRLGALQGLHDQLKGYRTVIVAVGLPAALALIEYVPEIAWTGLGVKPQTAAILTVVFTGLRFVTRAAIGKKPDEDHP